MQILGDYYWKDNTDIDRLIDITIRKMPVNIKNERELESFVNQEINKPIPLDNPQWVIWIQEDYNEKESLIIYKQHHSMCDGISCMNYHIGQGDNFDQSALMPFPRKITFIERFFIRLSVLYFLPKVFWKIVTVKQDINPLNDGIKNLSGKKLSATSKDIDFQEFKKASKLLKLTINDIVTACVGSAISQYFESKGRKDIKRLNIAIPANIRFAHYPSWEKVKFENKFAPFPMTIPLETDLDRSLVEVHKVTSRLRNGYGDVYATYAATWYASMFVPKWLMLWFSEFSTKPYTLAFSNLPGLLKPIIFDGRKSIKMQNYIIPAGVTGIGITSLSYVDYFKIGMVVDDSIMKEPQVIVDHIEKNLRIVMEKAKKL